MGDPVDERHSVEYLRKASNAIYLATEQSVAADVSAALQWAAAEIEHQREMISQLRQRLGWTP